MAEHLSARQRRPSMAKRKKRRTATLNPREAKAFEVPAGHFFRIVSVGGPQVGVAAAASPMTTALIVSVVESPVVRRGPLQKESA